MPDAETRDRTLKLLRERRERIARELASLETEADVLSAREYLTWRTRLAELEARIARYSEVAA
jgi:hypothetical protein